MDTVLISVTLVSLGLAGAMAVVLTKVLRDDRKRSDARVAALSELAADPTPAPAAAVTLRPAPAARVRVTREPAREPAREPVVAELEIRPAAAVPVAEIFAEPEQASPWGRRFAVIGTLAVVGGLILFTVTLRRAAPDASRPTAVASRPAAQAAAPLELVALRHSQEGDNLTITGLVQNPKGGAPMTRITATAVVFGTDGTFLASGKAPLDYTSLAAGDESPFVVTVPVRGAVARYRVGFRAEDGSVLAHVDRRAGDVARRVP
jgi:hypothetical protein